MQSLKDFHIMTIPYDVSQISDQSHPWTWDWLSLTTNALNTLFAIQFVATSNSSCFGAVSCHSCLSHFTCTFMSFRISLYATCHITARHAFFGGCDLVLLAPVAMCDMRSVKWYHGKAFQGVTIPVIYVGIVKISTPALSPKNRASQLLTTAGTIFEKWANSS